MNIFVGNVSFEATKEDVKRIFEELGLVSSAELVMEKKGKRSRGFGFVEMPDDEQARAAIAALDGFKFMGRPLNVSPARPKTAEERARELKKKIQLKMDVKAQIRGRREKDKKSAWVDEGLARTGGYKGGRRTRSFIRRVATGTQGRPMKPWEKPRRASRPWRKPHAQAKPWQKPPEELKPWQKNEGKPAQAAGSGQSSAEHVRQVHKNMRVARAGLKTRKGFKR